MAPSNGKDVVFGPLKEEWLEKKGFGEKQGVGETRLYQEIGKWVDGMLKEMIKKEDDTETYEKQCEEMYTGTEGMTKEVKEVCVFILKNLFNIKTMSVGPCEGKNVDKKMEEYVYCTVMSMWLFFYGRKHCKTASNVINSAFAAMKKLSRELDPAGKCKECEYKQLEPMKILRDFSLLNYIRTTMEGNPNVMTLINKGKPEKPCPEEKNFLSQLGFQHNGGAMTTTSTSGQQQQPAPQPKKMTTQQFHFISKLITNWVKTHGMEKVDQMGDKVWQDMKKEWEELKSRITNDRDTDIKRLCSISEGKKHGVEIKGQEQGMCKNMMHIYYYMQGLQTQTWKLPSKDTKNKEEKSFFRCIVGMMALFKLFGHRACFKKYTDYAHRVSEDARKGAGLADSTKICAGMNFDQLKIGTTFIGETISGWIGDVDKFPYGDRSNIISWDHWCKEEQRREQQSKEKSAKEDKPGWISEEDKKRMQEIVNKNQYIPKGQQDKVLKEMDEKMKDIKKKVWDRMGCTGGENGQFEEGEEDAIEEWFTEFFNKVTDDSDYYEEKYGSTIISACEGMGDDEESEKKWTQGDKEFCKVFMKNLLIVSKCKEETYTKKKCIKGGASCYYVEPCDLLKIWLGSVYSKCKLKDVVDIVSQTLEAMEESLNNNGNYKQCDLVKYANLYRGNKEMLSELFRVISENKLLSKLLNDRAKDWCTEIKTEINTGNGRGRSDSSVHGRTGRKSSEDSEKLEEVKDLIKGVENKLNLKDEIQKEISQAVDEVIQKHTPPPPPEPARPAAPGGQLHPKPSAAPENDGKSPIKDKGDYDVGPVAVSADGKTGTVEFSAGTHSGPGLEDPPEELFEGAEEGTTVQPAPAAEPADDELEEHSQTPHEVSGQPSSVSEDVQNADPEKVQQTGQNASTPEAASGESVGTVDSPSKEVHPKASNEHESAQDVDISSAFLGGQSPSSSLGTEHIGSGGSGRGGAGGIAPPVSAQISNNKDNLLDLLTPYLPLILVFIGMSAISYLFCKYFTIGKRRRRHRREEHLTSPSSEEQLLAHVDDQADGPHAYTLVKERKHRSTPKKSRKERGVRHRAGRRRGVRRRMIIDIYLEVLDECQRGNLHSKKEDFLEILVQEFTGNGFIKGKNVPKEQVPRSDSGFTEEDFVPKEQVQVPKESVPMVGVPKEQLLSSGFGFREGSLCS